MFIGHSYFLLEVYNDTNGNGVPDADYSVVPAESEICYYLRANASVTFLTDGIYEYTDSGVEHYNWSVTYQNIDAFLEPADPSGNGTLASLEFLRFSYDFSIQGNMTYLKSDFGIGNITLHSGPPGVSLDGLSLSTLYTTSFSSTLDLDVKVNDTPFDSRFASSSPTVADNSEIVTGTTSIYEMLFGFNYTWFQTTEGIELPSLTAACANSSLNGIYPQWRIGVDFLNDALAALASTVGLPTDLHIEPGASPLLYRVCYPSWGGFPLQHDPLFRAFIQTGLPPIYLPFLHPGIIIVGIGGLFILLGSLLSLRRTRRKTQNFNTPTEAPTDSA